MLTMLIFAGFFPGILAGWLAGESILPFAVPMKELFLRLLRMAILPLVITSIISAVVKVGSSRGLGRITLRTITYYLATSLLAILTAQVYGFELSFARQGIIVLTAILAYIGAASIPMSGLVMMSIILNAVGLPLEGIGIILAVDRILHMFRTTVNVFSDSVGAVVISRLENDDGKEAE